MTRRQFLGFSTASVGALGLEAATAVPATPGRQSGSETYLEPARSIPVAGDADVLVAGAGPAGIAAALAAARAGATTQLLECNGCLGGTWTAGLLSWVLDSGNKGGPLRTILKALHDRGAARHYGSSVAYDVEAMKYLLEEFCDNAGVNVQLHTRVVAAAADARDRQRLAFAVTESKSGRQAWRAKVFIDATGDGDLAALAGCRYDYGRNNSGEAQPMSMIACLTGLDPDQVAVFVRGLAEPRGERNPKGRLRQDMERAGLSPSYSQPTLFHLPGGLFCLMANHQYGVCGYDAAQVTAATLSGRAEVHRLIAALRRLGSPWQDVHIVATAEHIGVREGRRIHGLYRVTAADLATGKEHSDAVCRCRFGVDVHATDPATSKGISREPVRAKPYDIPFRALVARDVRALLLTGRCISGDFIAHSSYRVTGDAAATGHAAGVAAALAAHADALPENLPWSRIREVMDGWDGA